MSLIKLFTQSFLKLDTKSLLRAQLILGSLSFPISAALAKDSDDLIIRQALSDDALFGSPYTLEKTSLSGISKWTASFSSAPWNSDRKSIVVFQHGSKLKAPWVIEIQGNAISLVHFLSHVAIERAVAANREALYPLVQILRELRSLPRLNSLKSVLVKTREDLIVTLSREKNDLEIQIKNQTEHCEGLPETCAEMTLALREQFTKTEKNLVTLRTTTVDDSSIKIPDARLKIKNFDLEPGALNVSYDTEFVKFEWEPE